MGGVGHIRIARNIAVISHYIVFQHPVILVDRIAGLVSLRLAVHKLFQLGQGAILQATDFQNKIKDYE